MKNLITIIALFITTFVSAQTKLDSLVLVKVNEYRVSKGRRDIIHIEAFIISIINIIK